MAHLDIRNYSVGWELNLDIPNNLDKERKQAGALDYRLGQSMCRELSHTRQFLSPIHINDLLGVSLEAQSELAAEKDPHTW